MACFSGESRYLDNLKDRLKIQILNIENQVFSEIDDFLKVFEKLYQLFVNSYPILTLYIIIRYGKVHIKNKTNRYLSDLYNFPPIFTRDSLCLG